MGTTKNHTEKRLGGGNLDNRDQVHLKEDADISIGKSMNQVSDIICNSAFICDFVHVYMRNLLQLCLFVQ